VGSRSLSRRRFRVWFEGVSSYGGAGGLTPVGPLAEERRERQAIRRELCGLRLTVCLRLGLAGLGYEHRVSWGFGSDVNLDTNLVFQTRKTCWIDGLQEAFGDC
jgi:hypothetical protein